MTHSFIRWIGRRCLGWIYRERCVIGANRIPSTGPVLLIGNHPNDIPDVLCGFLSTSRPLRYVATVSAASSAASQAAYRGLGVIPVARVRDARKMRQQGRDAAALNVDAFRAVSDALREGAIVGVFPEGGVHEGPHLGHFRAGVSKMALEGTNDGTLSGLTIVAFGLQYEAARTPRSDLMVQIGEPFALDDWLREASRATDGQDGIGGHHVETPERRAARVALALRDRMREALLAVTRNAPSRESADRRDRMTAALAALGVESQRSVNAAPEVGADTLLERAARLQRPCGDIVESELAFDVALLSHVSSIGAVVEHAGGIATSARDTARVLSAAGAPVSRTDAAWPSLLRLIAMAPLAGLGWLVHAPAFAVIWRLAHRLAKDGAELMARVCVPGLYLIFAWYLLWGVLVGVVLAVAELPWWWVGLVVTCTLAAFPRLGDAAVRWRDDWRALRMRHRVRRLPDQDRTALRTAADALRAAWTIRISQDSSAFVKVAVNSAAPSAVRTAAAATDGGALARDTDPASVAPATRTAS